MRFRVGLENFEGRSLAWALEHPGCFAYGDDGDSALQGLPAAIHQYDAWISRHQNGLSWLDPHHPGMDLEDVWQVYSINPDFELAPQGYEVNAWFRYDWKPLTQEAMARGLQLLAWTREDLLESVQGLDPQALHTRFEGERWSISGILQHVGTAEWWYLDRLGLAFPRDKLPEEPFERLEAVRQHFRQVFSPLAGIQKVVGVDGEIWSPGKILRRAVWHEMDHGAHIRKLKLRLTEQHIPPDGPGKPD